MRSFRFDYPTNNGIVQGQANYEVAQECVVVTNVVLAFNDIYKISDTKCFSKQIQDAAHTNYLIEIESEDADQEMRAEMNEVQENYKMQVTY